MSLIIAFSLRILSKFPKVDIHCKTFSKSSRSFSVSSPCLMVTTANILVVVVCILIHHVFWITSVSCVDNHPFILIILAWAYNLCPVTFKLCFPFKMPYICFLYPFIGFPSLSVGLLKN